MTAGVLAVLALVAGADPAGAAGPTGPAGPEVRPLSSEARAEKHEVKLGEPFGYVVEVRHRPEESYALPPALALEPFRAADGATCRRAEQGGEATTTCSLSLALFALGEHEVPALPLAATTPAGRAVLRVQGPRITGVGIIDPSAPPGGLALRDLAPPAPLRVPTWAPVYWALGALAAIALAVLAWRAWRDRPRRVAEPPAPDPADLVLERGLAALAAERLPAQGRSREHLARLSGLVRAYLGSLMAANALDLTTAELLELVAREGDPRVDPPALSRVLAAADLAKFAKVEPDLATCEEGMGYAQALLARTRTAAGWSARSAATSTSTSTSTPTSTIESEPSFDRPGVDRSDPTSDETPPRRP